PRLGTAERPCVCSPSKPGPRAGASSATVAPPANSQSAVVRVAARASFGVDVRWRDELRSFVGAHADLPVAAVDAAMGERAQRHGVGAVGRAAVRPERDVVDLRPPTWAIASGECASAVTKDDRGPGSPGVGAAGTTDVDRDAGTVENHGEDLRVTRQ